eukprot:CAMPEP_0172440948 /NCGR_PEP_ID=MMETSP1065-20121228/1556_1 /TAXON_ID=265537 /ORGANISM="Amphiprora paludosa, Strain CCMP125" /LENGTH=123 /DNA_ID=CAMNT_0013190069 /DNA_START=26 /DNA_END=397 /DNA_ORIENTATION=-
MTKLLMMEMEDPEMMESMLEPSAETASLGTQKVHPSSNTTPQQRHSRAALFWALVTLSLLCLWPLIHGKMDEPIVRRRFMVSDEAYLQQERQPSIEALMLRGRMEETAQQQVKQQRKHVSSVP